MATKAQLIQQAQVFLRKKFEDTDIQTGYQIAESLERLSVFTYSRRVRQRLYRAKPSDLKNVRKLAVATYKDDDLPADRRYEVAANLLFKNYGDSPGAIQHTDAAGILGSIFKLKWRYDSQLKHLLQALNYYHRGYELFKTGEEKGYKAEIARLEQQIPVDTEALEKTRKAYEPLADAGYNAVNVAFVCDLLAAQIPKTAGNGSDPGNFIPEGFQQLAADARQYVLKYCEREEERLKALEQDPEHDGGKIEWYWFYATWAEALLGLKQPALAAKKLEAAMHKSDPEQWKIESTGRQLTELVALAYPENDPLYAAACKTLAMLLGATPSGDPSRKLGLALSGGGFRASIFHIGVLAKLAENNLLKDVEVISCVSGGSIIGAYYYLMIKRLLETKEDQEITQADYVGIVREIEQKFMAGISSNLRMRLFDNIWKNIIIGVRDEYTRTARLADLYEQELYAPLLPKEGPDTRIYMNDLFIRPYNRSSFNIRFDNISRKNKVPILVLNATSLNTGHCWQFTASWMGEPPAYINNELDARPTYRRMYYNEAPEKFRKVRLATAVSASSCVPGLFAPVTFEGLYESGTTLQLIDGGVFDNQGIISLNEQRCNEMIISDASGQMEAENAPGNTALSVIGRTNSILQERLRDYAYYDLEARHGAGVVKGYLLMHLTKGLPSEVVEWYPCDDRYEFEDDEESAKKDLTPHEIRKSVQTALAKIRTDLDSFHQLEAYALMYSGYKMTGYEMAKGQGSFMKTTRQAGSSGWQFEDYIPLHDKPEANKQALVKLHASDKRFGKLLTIAPMLKYAAWLVLIALFFLYDWFLNDKTVWKFLNAGRLSLFVIIAGGGILADAYWHKSKSLLGWWIKVSLGIPAMLLLWLLIWPMRQIFNRIYLNLGKVIKPVDEQAA